MSRLQRRRLRTGVFTLILAASAGLAACGQTGPLYLSEADNQQPAPAAPATAPSARTTPSAASASR